MTGAPPPRKRRADAERSIAAIVEAAVACLSQRPEASMAEVAEVAGVGRVTLYAHFPSREALLEAAIGRALAQSMAALDAADIDDGTAAEALGRMIRIGWPAFDRVWGLFVAAGTQPPEWVRDHGAGFMARVAHLVERGQAEGSFRSDLPREWLIAAFHGIVQTAGQAVGDGSLDPATAADVLEATLIGMLSAPPSTPGSARPGSSPAPESSAPGSPLG